MDINQYNLYSVMSEKNNKENGEYNNILTLIEKMEKIDNSKDAKEYIKQNWNIDTPVNKKLISDSCYLTVKDDNERLCINFIIKQDNISYFYNK